MRRFVKLNHVRSGVLSELSEIVAAIVEEADVLFQTIRALESCIVWPRESDTVQEEISLDPAQFPQNLSRCSRDLVHGVGVSPSDLYSRSAPGSSLQSIR